MGLALNIQVGLKSSHKFRGCRTPETGWVCLVQFPCGAMANVDPEVVCIGFRRHVSLVGFVVRMVKLVLFSVVFVWHATTCMLGTFFPLRVRACLSIVFELPFFYAAWLKAWRKTDFPFV